MTHGTVPFIHLTHGYRRSVALGAILSLALVSFGGGVWYGKAGPGTGAPMQGRLQAGQGGATRSAPRLSGGFIGGEIIAKDERSITVKLPDGGSRIVFLGDSAAVLKSTTGTTDDLSLGTAVVVTGQANPDGSVNAQTVQIRPAAPAPQR